MIDKLREFARFLNKHGVPLPFIRDPKTQRSSVSLTMMVLSFLVALIGLIGKASGFFGGVDLSQAMMLLGITSGLYFSRKISKDADKLTVEAEEEKKEE